MAMIEGLVAPSIDDQAKVVPGMADRGNTTTTILFGRFTLGKTEMVERGTGESRGFRLFV